jgi:hypothetical protein
MTHTRALLVLVSAALLAPTLLAPSAASAQTVQGQIIITEVPPTGPTVPPGYAPQQQVMAPQQQVVVAPPQQQMGCPPGSTLMPDRWGRPACMAEVTGHRIIGGLLGGGIGLLAGGYVASIFTTLFTGIVGAFSTGGSYTADSLNNYVTFGFIPIIGPWVQLGFAPPFADTGLYVWLAVEGLLQAGGLTMIIFGALGEDYTEFRPIAGLDLRLQPILSASTQGVSATLSF